MFAKVTAHGQRLMKRLRFHHRFIECFPSPLFPTHQQDSNVIPVDNSWKSFKADTPFEKVFLGNSKTIDHAKIRTLKEIEASETYSYKQ